MKKEEVMAKTDWERWKNDSSKYNPGDLVKIIYQPFFEDQGIIGKIGIIIKKTQSIDYIRYLYWDVIVEGKVYPVHYRNMEPLESQHHEYEKDT